jgi:hypothetical protein
VEWSEVGREGRREGRERRLSPAQREEVRRGWVVRNKFDDGKEVDQKHHELATQQQPVTMESWESTHFSNSTNRDEQR